MGTTPISRAVAMYAVSTLDAALADLTASSGTAESLDAAVERVADVRRKLAAELWGDCIHLLFPVDPHDLSEDAPRHCTKCGERFDPAEIDPVTLAVGRDRQQAEDEATKHEAVAF